MAVFEENWQKRIASIKGRINFMFNNDLLSDVSLVVRASSDEDDCKKSKMAIPAHKFVLSICSPVFFAMFNGEMAEKSDSVDLPDCEYEGVLEMLRYMYSEKVELNESNVMRVLYVAKKYLVNSLADECIRLLRNKLDPANVFCVLPYAQQYGEQILLDQCWEMIDRSTEEALKSEEFGTIERPLLEALVKRDSLTISEVELFKAVDLWATKECERQGMSTDGDAKRNVLGEKIVKEVRFPLMKKEEFATVVPDSKILTSLEVNNMMNNFNSVSTPPVGFHGDKRVGTSQSCFRYSCVIEKVLNIGAAHKKCLNFHTDKDITLHGIRLFGMENRSFEVMVRIKEISSDKLVAQKNGIFSSSMVHSRECSYHGFDAMFDPVKLKSKVKYNIKVSMNGPCSSYGMLNDIFASASTVRSHGVTFSFWNCQASLSSGFHECGQVGELFFRLP